MFPALAAFKNRKEDFFHTNALEWKVRSKAAIDNPSVTASPCHLPLHKGGFRRDTFRTATTSQGRILMGQGEPRWQQRHKNEKGCPCAAEVCKIRPGSQRQPFP
jgi:hypothetical protein